MFGFIVQRRRRAFLQQLADALGPAFTATIEAAQPAERLRVETAEGSTSVAAVAIDGTRMSFVDFPGPGVPHYRMADGSVACTLEQAVEALEHWREARIPLAWEPVPLLGRLRTPLVNLARARAAATDELVVVEADVEVEASKIARYAPRDARGRLELGAVAILEVPPTSKRSATGRKRCLVARNPAKRRDPQVVTVTWDAPVVENTPYRWDLAPWCWTSNEAPALPDGALACAQDLDEGRIPEAFARFGVAVSDAVLRLVLGLPIPGHPPDLAERWAPRVRETLWACAPWQLGDAPERVIRVLPGLRTAQKASLSWSGGQLRFEHSGSQRRLAEVYWRRDPDVDIQRLDILGKTRA